MFPITKLFMLMSVGFFIPTQIDFHRRQDFSEKSLAGLYQGKNKIELAKSLMYLFKIHCQYWAIPCFVLHFFYKFFNHRMKWNKPVGDYLDVGYIASYAVRNHHNSLLKIYLSLGFNPCFRDAGCTTLFEYAFLYDNKAAGVFLAQYQDVVNNACVSQEWLDKKSKKNIRVFSAFGSPIFLTAQFFLERFVIVKSISFSGLELMPNMFDDSGKLLPDKLYEFNLNSLRAKITENNSVIEYNKSEYTIGLKLFEKICLEEDFSAIDVQFLRDCNF